MFDPAARRLNRKRSRHQVCKLCKNVHHGEGSGCPGMEGTPRPGLAGWGAVGDPALESQYALPANASFPDRVHAFYESFTERKEARRFTQARSTIPLQRYVMVRAVLCRGRASTPTNGATARRTTAARSPSSRASASRRSRCCSVRARPPGAAKRLAFLSVFLCKSALYGVFVWARRALNS